MAIVLGIAGGFNSGKSTLAAELCARLGWPVASFGAYVRSEAAERGRDERRETLQALGEHLIEELGWLEFVGRVLRLVPADEDIIVEGFRHIAALDAAREIARPRHFVCIGVRADPNVVAARSSPTPQTAPDAVIAQHSTEAEVRSVLDLHVDLLVGGDVRSAADSVLEYLEGLADEGAGRLKI